VCLDNHEVAALDKSALYLFNKDGKLLKKILEKKAFELRGLAFSKVRLEHFFDQS
jgi:hypothetical protein